MRHSLEVGLSFGAASGVITTLGLMVGLSSGTDSRLAVLGGIVVIAVADAMSDAFGIHVSEESEGKHTRREIWESTLATLGSKFLLAISFVVPVLLLELRMAVFASVTWGIFLICLLSYFMAKRSGEAPWKVMASHAAMTVFIVVVSHYIGEFVAMSFPI